eukprot:497475-Hanusia_phi.AAC.2
MEESFSAASQCRSDGGLAQVLLPGSQSSTTGTHCMPINCRPIILTRHIKGGSDVTCNLAKSSSESRRRGGVALGARVSASHPGPPGGTLTDHPNRSMPGFRTVTVGRQPDNLFIIKSGA